jgi:hypothetical protein
MALEDMKGEGRWCGDVYQILRRYLDANIGKPWAILYSHICNVADSRTHLGFELRRAVDSEVDMNGNVEHIRYRNDYYVDGQGLLRRFAEKHWGSAYRKRQQAAPIEKICFKEDGPDLWYRVVSIPDGPKTSKYTKFHWTWFRVARTIVKDSYPVDPVTNYARNIGLKKGKKDWYKETTTETIRETQVGGKLLDILRLIGARQAIKPRKILHLFYHYDHEKERHSMTAIVSGKSQ